jgi:acyl-CoA thioester hydrolase
LRPKSIDLEPHGSNQSYFRDRNTNLVWHAARTRVLYADTDCSGAVYHSNHLKYFELGRADLMRGAGHPYRQVEAEGYVYPIIRCGVNYYQTLNYDDPLVILTRPGRMERVRVSFDYVILKEGQNAPSADGFTTHCALNARKTPVAVDERTRRIWSEFPR